MKLVAAVLIAASTALVIPKQNESKTTKPDQTTAAAGAASLLKAIKNNDSSIAANFFFPADAFDLVKDIPVPGRYHRKLVRYYEEDIKKEHKRFRNDDWQFEKIEIGRCKWKEPGTEGNKVGYWSCRRNMVTARNGEKKRRFEIRVIINWGTNWYVTHLGPIR